MYVVRWVVSAPRMAAVEWSVVVWPKPARHKNILLPLSGALLSSQLGTFAFASNSEPNLPFPLIPNQILASIVLYAYFPTSPQSASGCKLKAATVNRCVVGYNIVGNYRPHTNVRNFFILRCWLVKAFPYLRPFHENRCFLRCRRNTDWLIYAFLLHKVLFQFNLFFFVFWICLLLS